MISENVYSLRVSQHLDASSISLRTSLFSLSCLLPLEFPQQHITFSRDESGIHETRRSFSSIVTASIDALGSFERWNDAVNAVLIFRLLRLSVATSVSKWTEISEWHLSLSNTSQIIESQSYVATWTRELDHPAIGNEGERDRKWIEIIEIALRRSRLSVSSRCQQIRALIRYRKGNYFSSQHVVPFLAVPLGLSVFILSAFIILTLITFYYPASPTRDVCNRKGEGCSSRVSCALLSRENCYYKFLKRRKDISDENFLRWYCVRGSTI